MLRIAGSKRSFGRRGKDLGRPITSQPTDGGIEMPSRRPSKTAIARTALLAAALASLALTASASAQLTGAFTRFAFCPYKTPGVARCAYSVTDGGEVVLGSKKVPIVNPVTLQ